MGRRSQTEPLIQALDASELARERVTIILLTLTGDWSVADAMERLSISRTRFQDLRRTMLQAALFALEPGRAGRPPRSRDPRKEAMESLRKEIATLEQDLKRTRVQLELARGPAAKAIQRRLESAFLSKTWSKK